MNSIPDATAKKIMMYARSNGWWNDDMKERRSTVGRDRRRRQYPKVAALPNAELQKSIRQSKSKMSGNYL